MLKIEFESHIQTYRKIQIHVQEFCRSHSIKVVRDNFPILGEMHGECRRAHSLVRANADARGEEMFTVREQEHKGLCSLSFISTLLASSARFSFFFV